MPRWGQLSRMAKASPRAFLPITRGIPSNIAVPSSLPRTCSLRNAGYQKPRSIPWSVVSKVDCNRSLTALPQNLSGFQGGTSWRQTSRQAKSPAVLNDKPGNRLAFYPHRRERFEGPESLAGDSFPSARHERAVPVRLRQHRHRLAPISDQDRLSAFDESKISSEAVLEIANSDSNHYCSF